MKDIEGVIIAYLWILVFFTAIVFTAAIPFIAVLWVAKQVLS
jgi:hypothetical protein